MKIQGEATIATASAAQAKAEAVSQNQAAVLAKCQQADDINQRFEEGW